MLKKRSKRTSRKRGNTQTCEDYSAKRDNMRGSRRGYGRGVSIDEGLSPERIPNLKGLSREELDSFLEALGEANEPLPDLAILCYQKEAKVLADAAGVEIEDITIFACPPVGEDCYYVKGKWSGYMSDKENNDATN